MVAIKRKKSNKADIERKICVACIISDLVLARVSKIYKSDLVLNKSIDEIITWCVEYHKKYTVAPEATIQDVFDRKMRKTKDDDRYATLSAILSLCDKEFNRDCVNFNDEFYLDLCLEYFSERQLTNLTEDVQHEISVGNISEAEMKMIGYKRVQVTTDDSINPLTNAEEIAAAFEASDEPILRFKGAFGELTEEVNHRGDFVAFLAPEKTGKTFMLCDYVFAGLRARCNVALFGAGDMNKRQMIIRLGIRLVGRSNKKKYCGELLVPVLDCVYNQDNTCKSRRRTNNCALGIQKDDLWAGEFDFEEADPEYTPCTNCKKGKSTFWYKKRPPVQPLEWREAFKAGVRFFKRMVGREFKMECFPNNSLSVYDIECRLRLWEEVNGFIPDLVVIDYADILAPEPGLTTKDTRTVENERWKALRSLADRGHCLVVTATQADAASYTQDRLNQTNFSEDKRKLSHVTAMFGLNKNNLEKRLGIMRVNEIVRREGDFFTDREVKVLQRLEMGRPLLDSFWILLILFTL